MKRVLQFTALTVGAAVAIVFALASTSIFVGCAEQPKPAGSTAGSAPSLESKHAEERAAAARDAAKKFGTAP